MTRQELLDLCFQPRARLKDSEGKRAETPVVTVQLSTPVDVQVFQIKKGFACFAEVCGVPVRRKYVGYRRHTAIKRFTKLITEMEAKLLKQPKRRRTIKASLIGEFNKPARGKK